MNDVTLSEETFSYDAAGNLIGGSSETGFVYDTNNRLISIDGEAVSYDADGNMLSMTLDGEERSLTYDSANRLLPAVICGYIFLTEDFPRCHKMTLSIWIIKAYIICQWFLKFYREKIKKYRFLGFILLLSFPCKKYRHEHFVKIIISPAYPTRRICFFLSPFCLPSHEICTTSLTERFIALRASREQDDSSKFISSSRYRGIHSFFVCQ